MSTVYMRSEWTGRAKIDWSDKIAYLYIMYNIYIYKPKGCNYVVIYSAGNKSSLLLRVCTPRGSDGRSEFIVVKQATGRCIVTASNFTAIKLRLDSRTSYSIKLSTYLHLYSLNTM